MVNLAKDAQVVGPDLPSDAAALATLLEGQAALLARQAALLARLDEVHEVLAHTVAGGGSLDDLCRELAAVLPGAVMVTTADGRVLARGGSETEVGLAEALECFDASGRLVTEREPLSSRTGQRAAAHRALVAIRAGGRDCGRLALFRSDAALTEDDLHVLERAATVAGLAITKQEAVAAVESKYRAEFLRDVLAGRAGAAADVLAHARALGWQLEGRMVVVVAETDEDDEHTARPAGEVRSLQQRFGRAWTQAVGVRDAHAPVMATGREVVAVLPVGDGTAATAVRTVTDLARVVRGDGGGGRRSFSTGVSRAIERVEDLGTAYEQGRRALHVGRQVQGDGALAHVDELGVFRLLAQVQDTAELRRFVTESLGELATDDAPEHADLRQTLRILIETNLNVAETARLLFFHYNTLRYRIAKLEKMLGPFTTDPELRLTLALALKVHQMRGI